MSASSKSENISAHQRGDFRCTNGGHAAAGESRYAVEKRSMLRTAEGRLDVKGKGQRSVDSTVRKKTRGGELNLHEEQ